MTIVFLSNFYNHHQAYLSQALCALTEGNYCFIATSEVPEERKKLGYKEITDQFVLSYNSDTSSADKAQKLIDNADLVIVGEAPEFLLNNRKKARKLIFRYSERPLKKGFEWWKYPIRWYRWHRDNPRSSPIYMLCASAYAASDYLRFGVFKDRMYKWGYFPECKKYEDIDTLIAKKNKKQILWCGRFLDWKHPDDALTVAKCLKEENYDFHLNIIGTGEMQEILHSMAMEKELSDVVTFCGSMSPESVRKNMEESGIYLFTSDKKEGWGAVLNEAMNSGCAVIASCAIGAAPYLIDDNKSGMLYESGNVEMLLEKTRHLLDNTEEQIKLGKSAYKTIIDEWNSEISAKRLIALTEEFLNGNSQPKLYANGPCSVAECIVEEWS